MVGYEMSSQLVGHLRGLLSVERRHARMARGIALGCALLLIQAACIARFGPGGHGQLFSAFLLLVEGAACATACFGASRRSGPLGRYFWRLVTLSFLFWIVAEAVDNFAPQHALGDFLFQLATFPLGMTLFLEPDYEPARFDPLQ